jgi:hypothetical protein
MKSACLALCSSTRSGLWWWLKVLALDRILASKIAANRPKDTLTIPILRDALAATQSLKLQPKKK